MALMASISSARKYFSCQGAYLCPLRVRHGCRRHSRKFSTKSFMASMPLTAYRLVRTEWVLVHHDVVHRAIKIPFRIHSLGHLCDGHLSGSPDIVVPLRSDISVLRQRTQILIEKIVTTLKWLRDKESGGVIVGLAGSGKFIVRLISAKRPLRRRSTRSAGARISPSSAADFFPWTVAALCRRCPKGF